MFNDPAVSMDELERESAEFLPSRETLWVSRWHPAQSTSFSFTQVDGNTTQAGLINVAILNGSFDSLL